MKLSLPFAALALLASPALAATSPNADRLTAHMEALDTPLAEACMGENPDPAQAVETCQSALDELARTRKKSPGASIGERANFDFLEAVLLSSLAAAYVEIDQDVTARVCSTFERFWTLRHGLLNVPESEVSAEAYRVFQQVPPDIGTILDMCRSKFGAPSDGAPRPADQ